MQRTMNFKVVSRSLALVIAFFGFAAGGVAQQSQFPSQEISEDDGLPVLLKHLPDWEKVRGSAVFAVSRPELETVLGKRPVLDLIDFDGGTESVTASYGSGKLLIVEYTTPQLSVEADTKFTGFIAQNPTVPPIVYRRVGNYSVFVFDGLDEVAANALIDRVKYEKHVQWLGEDPFYFEKFERYMGVTLRDVFISTVLWISMGIGLSVVLGLIARSANKSGRRSPLSQMPAA
jgi:hypothetical protein